jgi:signal transduction histidine kinase
MARANPFQDTDTTSSLLRTVAWGATPLGSPDGWPESLTSAVRACLAARLPMAVCWGKDLTTIYNDAFRPVLGVRHPSSVGRPYREVWGDLGPRLLPMVDAVFATGRASSAAEVAIPVLRDEQPVEVYFDMACSALSDENGATAGVLIVFVDTTHHVLARRQALRSCDQARAAAMREVAEARAEAERANSVKDEFLAMLGHELRNPLAPIFTALELMSTRTDANADHERRVIDRQVRHLVRLVDDLLDVSRITRGKIELQRVQLDLASVVADGIEQASPLLEQRAHSLTVNVPKGRFFVHGDRPRLAQIVSNLVANAAKYTDARGTIEIDATAAGSEVVLRVRDTGMGMPPELVPRVFDLFEQGARTIDRAAGGLGLGLAIVKSLTLMHGGAVSATSEGPGKGSEFLVRLPAMSPQERGHAPPSPPPRSDRDPGARRVLIVDDNEDGADLLELAVRSMGHTTRVAHDGPGAVQAALEFQPDVALIDIGLPVMDGYEVARRIRAMSDGHCPKLVAVTGYGQESDRRRSREAGFDRHLVKPVELARISEIFSSTRR